MANESSIEKFLECFARTGMNAPVFAEPYLDLAHASHRRPHRPRPVPAETRATAGWELDRWARGGAFSWG